MAEYIDKEAALEIVAEWCPDDDGSIGKIGDLREMLDEIESIPAADVRPVRWIPVEERMPETDKLVLVVRSDGDMAVAGWNAALGWLHYWSGFRVRNVTHWMPLPELPSVNGKETEHDTERKG